jgi:RNA polymerase sigma-70 factor (ECF subfamily)
MCSGSAPARSPKCSIRPSHPSTACCAARAAFETRLPAAGRERPPLPNSKCERDIVGRFADAFEAGDMDRVVELVTDDAWLTMPPESYAYQGPAAIGVFLHDRAGRRGAPARLVPTLANGQPAFGCYLRRPLVAQEQWPRS